MLLMLLPSQYIIYILKTDSNNMIVAKHKKKCNEHLSFPASSIATSLLTPDNSPYTSKTNTPIRHTPSQSIAEDTHICKRLFTDS